MNDDPFDDSVSWMWLPAAGARGGERRRAGAAGLRGGEAQSPRGAPERVVVRSGHGPGSGALLPAVRVGRWTIRVGARGPKPPGPIGFDPDKPRADGSHALAHELVFTNTGERPVSFDDTRGSRLLGGAGRREPLAADELCGYSQDRPGAAIQAGACRLSYNGFTVEPGAAERRPITLSWDLPGAGRLAAGTYVFSRRVRFWPGRRAHAGRARQGVVRLAYTVTGPSGDRATSGP